MTPVLLPAATVQAVCRRLSTTYRGIALSEYVSVTRGAGRVVLSATDYHTLSLFCHLPAPLPVTDFQRRLVEPKWKAEAVAFLVPFAHLRNAATARGAVRLSLLPGEILSGPLRVSRWDDPDPEVFPMDALPPLAELREGWQTMTIRTGRVDVAALAASEP